MKSYSLRSLANQSLLHALAELVSRDRVTTAELLAHIAEVEARRLYAPAGYDSMYSYCVGELRMTKDMALVRIRAARVARRFPAIFEAIADGRLHLSAVIQLAPHLVEFNANDLLAAADFRTKSEIERLLAERSPRVDVPTRLVAIPAHVLTSEQLVPERPGETAELVPEPVGTEFELVPEPVASPVQVVEIRKWARLRPLAPHRYSLECTFDQEMHDDLERARDLFSSAIPSGDVVQLLGRALKALVREGEKGKFAATSKPRTSAPPADTRRIPAHVRRAVRERDGGRCTFVSDSGHRCEARKFIEFDHIEPVARGGQSTIANVRLRCRAHNQLAAERAYGADFMRGKRDAARKWRVEVSQQDAAEGARAEAARLESAEKARAAAEQVRAAAEAHAAAERAQSEVVPLLRQLGFRASEARRAAALGAADPAVPLEQRVRLALRHLAPPCARYGVAPSTSPP